MFILSLGLFSASGIGEKGAESSTAVTAAESRFLTPVLLRTTGSPISPFGKIVKDTVAEFFAVPSGVFQKE